MKEEDKFVQKAREGDPEAFGVLYDKYLPKIYRFIFLKVSKRADAEDITHQVFLSAWENIKSYKTRGHPFSSWLYRIARNTVVDFYRTKKDAIGLDSVQNELILEYPSLEEKVDQSIGVATVAKNLKKLTDDEQSVLVLKFVNELSNKEISLAMQKSEGAVRVIQHRALKQLKELIENEKHHNTTESA